MENHRNDQIPPPCPCPCTPRIEALKALVQDQGRQLAELNRRIQNAGLSFCCDIAQIIPQESVAGPYVHLQQLANEGSTAESESTAASNEEETADGFSSQDDQGDGIDEPMSSISIMNVRGAASSGTADAPSIPAPPPPVFPHGQTKRVKICAKSTQKVVVATTTKKSRKVKVKNSCGSFCCEYVEGRGKRGEQTLDQGKAHEEVSTEIDGLFKCKCDREFVSRKVLRLHINRNLQEWDYQCEICEKPFYVKSQLNGHMRINHKILGYSLNED